MIQFADPAASGLSTATQGVPEANGLGDEIARVSAHIEAATGYLLDLIRAFDDSEEWYEQGF